MQRHVAIFSCTCLWFVQVSHGTPGPISAVHAWRQDKMNPGSYMTFALQLGSIVSNLVSSRLTPMSRPSTVSCMAI